MKITVSVIGVPEMTEPAEITLFEPHVTAETLLDAIQQSSNHLHRYNIRKDFSLLINGRNVLSLPDELQTKLQDGDEVILTIPVMGG